MLFMKPLKDFFMRELIPRPLNFRYDPLSFTNHMQFISGCFELICSYKALVLSAKSGELANIQSRELLGINRFKKLK